MPLFNVNYNWDWKNQGMVSMIIKINVAFFVFCACVSGVAAKKQDVIVVKDLRDTEMRYKLIPLGILEYGDVNRICRPWLSPGGLLVHERTRSSILVYDTPQVIDRIASFLRRTDQDAPNIRVTFELEQENTGTELKVDGSKKRPTRGRTIKDSKFTSQFIVAKSGMPALIWVGDVMADPGWVDYVKHNRGKDNGGRQLNSPRGSGGARVSTNVSLQVRPLWYDDGTIEVEIYPEIRYMDNQGRRRELKVLELATRVRVKEGQRVQIGGIISRQKQNYVNIFGPDFFKRKDVSKIFNMYLQAERAGFSGGLPGRGGK
jgi:type II secretory pathway component GspD/PulD (secretin)